MKLFHPSRIGSRRSSTSFSDQKIAVRALIEGLRMGKFKESLLKKNPMSLEEVIECAYKYIRIDEAEKRDGKGRGKLADGVPNQKGGAPRTGSGCRTRDTLGHISLIVAPSPASRMRRKRRLKGGILNT
ncbi:hypothetical protein LIER_35571 [Lithospermum erythrorhizon]|uniref:Uncharacterized protein n=1 Tax=Lithospermum erythrorhizon TaxID=34254 RepID=A0AAV3NUE8_LITER